MPKIKVNDLAVIKDKIREKTNLQEGAGRVKITVHMGTCGIASGAKDIMNTLKEEMKTYGVDDIMVKTSGCAGFCSKEPMITVEIKDNPPVKYGDLTPAKVREIFKNHVMEGNLIPKYLLVVGSERIA
ncbi:MAG: (2Fe-2S) ferredoxin domain-containing protein [bacterium]